MWDETGLARCSDLSSSAVCHLERELVWIVEDDLKTSNAFAWHFEHAGFDVVQMLDVADVERQAVLPAFVVLDISLCGGDAIDVFKLIQAKKIDASIQIVSAMTADVIEGVADVGRRRGLNVLPALRKPVSFDELCDAAKRAVRRRRSDRAGGHGERRGETAVSRPADAHCRAPDVVDLGQALRSGWLDVHYQPKVDPATGTVVGAECLSRLDHPTLGLVMPGAFLRDARQDDLLALTEAVVRRACADWSDFDAAGHPLRLALNMPGWAMTQLPLVQLVRETSPRSPRWPGLILELTEEDALGDIDGAREIAAQLKIYDVFLSIDDFGLGYSSLGRLREIPFREIKLDRSLVDGCATDLTKASLCRSVIEMAHSFGAVAVAEGVEQDADLAFLRNVRCDVAQGYLLGKPLPKRDFLRHMQAVAKPSSLPATLEMATLSRSNDVFKRGSGDIALAARRRRTPMRLGRAL